MSTRIRYPQEPECIECHGDLPKGKPRFCCPGCSNAHKNRARSQAMAAKNGQPPSAAGLRPGRDKLYGLILPTRAAEVLRPGADAHAKKHGTAAAQVWVLEKLNEASRRASLVPPRGETGSALGWV